MVIQINLVARIDADKNNFLDLVYMAYKLKQAEVNNFKVNFIGGIYNLAIHQNIIRMANLLSVSDKINFTGKSIPMKDLPAEIKEGYFLNYTVGSFTGYSGLESINNNFRTLFVNWDQNIILDDSEQRHFHPNIDSLIDTVKNICKDPVAADKMIFESNRLLKKRFLLNTKEQSSLLLLLTAN